MAREKPINVNWESLVQAVGFRGLHKHFCVSNEGMQIGNISCSVGERASDLALKVWKEYNESLLEGEGGHTRSSSKEQYYSGAFWQLSVNHGKHADNLTPVDQTGLRWTASWCFEFRLITVRFTMDSWRGKKRLYWLRIWAGDGQMLMRCNITYHHQMADMYTLR